MRGIVHQFLKWFPTALFGAGLAIAAAWPSAHDWIGSTVATAWSAITSNGYIAAAVVAAVVLYGAAVVLTYERNDRPKLIGNVDQMISNENDGRLWVWLNVAIRNVGTPTIVEHWEVFYAPKDGEPQKLDNFALVQEMVLGMREGARTLRRDRDSLVDKCITPIAQGGIVRGWIHAISPGPLHAADPRFEVRFKDVAGRCYRAVSNFDIGGGKSRYYPDGTGGEFMSIEDFNRFAAENPEVMR